MYDYLVVGAGLFGSVFAREVAEIGKTCLVIDKRNHIGGNVYTREEHGINVHVYGPHIFHTNSDKIWQYVTRFAQFNQYQHKVRALWNGKIYSVPFNMLTYYQLWGCTTPKEAEIKLKEQRVPCTNPRNLEEWALSQVGYDIYQKLIYGYTRKQWGRDPSLLPASIIKRLPLRMTWDDSYHNALYQGIPIDGYTKMVENILNHKNIKVKTEEDFFDLQWQKIAKKLVYTGPIDRFFNYKYGPLEYRSLRFEHKIHDGDFQGCSQINYTDESVPWTRSIEHQHFEFKNTKQSVVTLEYPQQWTVEKEPYYPINDDKNIDLFAKYKSLANQEENIIFGGRLGTYAYLDMHQVVGMALNIAGKENNSSI